MPLRHPRVEALSNTLRGFFRPVHVDAETLVAFEFGPEGFTPALIPNEPVNRVPAIAYQGQAVLERASGGAWARR